MTTSFSLRTLSRDDILEHLPELTDILVSCVNGAGYGDRQRSRKLLCTVWLGKSRGNSTLCADARRRADGNIAVL